MPSEKQFLGTWSVNKKLFIGTTGVLKSEKGTWKCGKKAGRVEQKKLDELWDEVNSIAVLCFCADFGSLQNSIGVQK